MRKPHLLALSCAIASSSTCVISGHWSKIWRYPKWPNRPTWWGMIQTLALDGLYTTYTWGSTEELITIGKLGIHFSSVLIWFIGFFLTNLLIVKINVSPPACLSWNKTIILVIIINKLRVICNPSHQVAEPSPLYENVHMAFLNQEFKSYSSVYSLTSPIDDRHCLNGVWITALEYQWNYCLY